MQSNRSRPTGPAAKAPPKPLSAAAIKKAEAAGQTLYRTRDGAAFTERAARRAYRKAQKAGQS
jgi:hypothetical protein